MLATPLVPQFTQPTLPTFTGSLSSLPIHVESSPLVLVIFTLLVGIFIAAVSVVLIYHWRRFPFEHDLFRAAERFYLAGVAILFTVAVVGILIA